MKRVRLSVLGGLLAVATATSGCSSVKSMFSSSSDGDASAVQASADGVKPPADFDCPSVEVRSGAATLTIASQQVGPSGSPELRYQGTIVRAARECSLNAGVVGLKVGIEGRIVLGPAGGPGQVDVPIRIAVVQEGANPKTIATKLYRTSVAIPADQGNYNFSYVAEDLSFPMPRPGELEKYVVYLGFDSQAESRARPTPRKPAPRKRAPAQG